jgi:ADP-ribose pyrophosphatase YjhB (NUDIX family)
LVTDAISLKSSVESSGPALLVQTFVFAEDHVLLMKRGFAPYKGKWAPPGGYVEAYESPEEAAMRETFEEVGVELDIEGLLPLATASVASINQFYLAFIVRLDTRVNLRPTAPEALDAQWFPRTAFPLADIWDPMLRFDMSEMFGRARSNRFEFYQGTEDFNRVISQDDQVRYLRGTGRVTRKW